MKKKQPKKENTLVPKYVLDEVEPDSISLLILIAIRDYQIINHGDSPSLIVIHPYAFAKLKEECAVVNFSWDNASKGSLRFQDIKLIRSEDLDKLEVIVR